MPKSSGFRNTYTSQFVPLPLEQFARTNELNQAKQDAEVKQLEDTDDALWKVKGVADADNEYIAGLKGSFETAASDLVNKDLTQKENQNAARGLIKGVSRDKDLNTIMANTAKYQEYLKNKDDAVKGGHYSEENDMFLPTLQAYGKGGYKSGVALDPTIYKYEKVRPVQEEFVDNMGENGFDDVKSVGETYYNNGWKGVTKDRAYARVKSAFDQYVGTTAAQQESRRYDLLAKKGQVDSKKMTKEEFLFKGLLDAGLERVHGVSSSGLAAAMNAENKRKKDEAKEKAEAANLGTFLTQGANPVLTGGYSFDYDDDGNIKGSGQSWKDTWDKSTGIFDFIKKAATDDSFNMNDSKDKTAFMLQAAAKLNGMKPKDYVEMKAGPDVKLTTTFTVPPIKRLDALNKSFYDMQRNTGTFATIPAMDITTGEKGSLPEILRLMSERGELLDKDGQPIEISDKATPGEIINVLKQTKTGVIGEQAPNYNSAKSMVIGVGSRQISLDRTYGGLLNNTLIEKGELTPDDIKTARKEAIKAAPIIENGYIHYLDERPGSKTKGQIMKEKLENLKD